MLFFTDERTNGQTDCRVEWPGRETQHALYFKYSDANTAAVLIKRMVPRYRRLGWILISNHGLFRTD